eukprot:TRINITY_DN1084_c0_g1_i2.p1 TRINITY_DN1084_c0_g1~~TRINITY_DN1084_c0_g1_i2.p1  ORF type:complete len:587 (+),score=184.77 TRINITY_DN1084_c0_g1_i2:35-1762(+)
MSAPSEQAPVPGPSGEAPLSKKAQNKLKKEQEKAAKKAQFKKADAASSSLGSSSGSGEAEAVSGDNFGDLPLNQSQTPFGARKFVEIADLAKHQDQEVLLHARLHNSRGKGNLVFLVLRQRTHTLQGVLSKSDLISKPMLKYASLIPRESMVEVTGTVRATPAPVEGTTQPNYELHISKLFVASKALPSLPLLLEDAGRPVEAIEKQDKEVAEIEAKIGALKIGEANYEEELQRLTSAKSAAMKFPVVGLDVRLDNRVLDLRVPAHQAIFTIQSGVCQLFREFLIGERFTEIHTPKIQGGASEGGAQVFKLDYFKEKAFLAQSPQLFKQMAVCGDIDRVFEIGPVFRAENANTHRHLCEFVGLDVEMAFHDHYHEALDVLDRMFIAIFEGLETRFAHELKMVSLQYPFEPFKYHKPSLRLKFPEGIAMLRAAGVEIGDLDDFSTPQEKLLGKLVKEKYNTDFYILDRYPADVRPFYTMPCPDDNRYTNSYDMFVRGEEIVSGSQRIHDPELLVKRAAAKGIDVSTIQFYIDAFKYGAPPHAGCGVGLERIVMLYLDLHNIRKSSLFPRDPHRLLP